MLGNAHRKQDADAVGRGNLMRNLGQSALRHAGDLFGILHRVGFQRLLIFLEVIDPLVDEVHLRESAVDDVLRSGAHPHCIGRWVGLKEDIGTLGHLILAQVGDDQPLPAMLVRPLDARAEHRVILRRIRPYDDHQASLLDVRDRAGVATVAHCSLQPHGRRVLAVAGAVVDVVCPNHSARELLHQEALFIGALRRGDKRERIWAVVLNDAFEGLLDNVERLGPFNLAIAFTVAKQRLYQAVIGVDVAPGILALHAG